MLCTSTEAELNTVRINLNGIRRTSGEKNSAHTGCYGSTCPFPDLTQSTLQQVYDPCKITLLTSQCIEQKQNDEQRSHLHLEKKGKTMGNDCSFYTEYEPCNKVSQFYAQLLPGL